MQVFHDEGRSLHSMMYGHASAPGGSGSDSGAVDGTSQHAEMVQQTPWWWALRKDAKVGDGMHNRSSQCIHGATMLASGVAQLQVYPDLLWLLLSEATCLLRALFCRATF